MRKTRARAIAWVTYHIDTKRKKPTYTLHIMLLHCVDQWTIRWYSKGFFFLFPFSYSKNVYIM